MNQYSHFWLIHFRLLIIVYPTSRPMPYSVLQFNYAITLFNHSCVFKYCFIKQGSVASVLATNLIYLYHWWLVVWGGIWLIIITLSTFNKMNWAERFYCTQCLYMYMVCAVMYFRGSCLLHGPAMIAGLKLIICWQKTTFWVYNMSNSLYTHAS